MSITHLQTPRAPRRVVVLGGSGFVGRHLARLLHERSVPVVALSSRDVELGTPEAPRRLTALLQPGDALVFAAALTPDRGNDVATLMRNLRMAEGLADLERPPLSHLLYVSSDAVYGFADSLIRDATPPAPPTLYGHMHFVREHMVRSLAEKWDCPLLIVRPCALYGPGDPHHSYGPNRFLRSAAREGRISLFGEGEERRDHLFVADFVRILADFLFRRSAGSVAVATGRSAPFADVARQVAGLFDGPVEITTRPRATPVTHRHFDISELIRALPAVRFTPLADGLRACAEALRAPQAA